MDKLILKNLLINQDYVNKVIYYLKQEYFETHANQIIFKKILNYINKYSSKILPTITVLISEISKTRNLTEHQFLEISKNIKELEIEIEKTKNEKYEIEWLIDETENFCKLKAMELAIMNSVEVIQSKSKNLNKVSEIIKDALRVSFDDDLGIDFYNDIDIDERIEYYNRKILKIPCKLKDLNAAFNGGFEEKTLTIFMGGQHSGKTQTMRSICKDMIENGTDCVYITLEMSEEKISQGIEANILEIPINDIPDSDMTDFKDKLISHGEGKGRLWIKEWPTRGASTASVRHYLDELYIKKNFKPKMVFIDYINLLNSDLYTGNQEHLRIKSIAEELRGLGVEIKSGIVSGTQTNRRGDNASDLTLKEIADSFGLSGPSDAIIAIISTEEMREKGILLFKIIKNRFGGVIDFKFPVKAETEYSRITNIKKDEMPKLSNSIESKEKMNALYEKFTRDRSPQNKNILNISKGIDELCHTKKKIKLKIDDTDDDNFEKLINEID